jgi:hypothetical protein
MKNMLVEQNDAFNHLRQSVTLIELVMCSTDFPLKTMHDKNIKDGVKDNSCQVSDDIGGDSCL